MLTLVGLLPAAILLILVNEFFPRYSYLVRPDDEFKRYALRQLRPFAYAMSAGAFCALAVIEANNPGAVLGAIFIVPAIYMAAEKAYRHAKAA
jgi:hypothetical protein